MESDERYQPSYDLSALKKSYEEVLSSITSTDFVVDEDLYSGVFLARPFDAYWQTHKKIMIVGRETAGWNTGNGLNTLSRIVQANAWNTLPSIIDESFERYSWHLLNKKGGQLRKKTSSWFQRFYADIAKRLYLPPDALLYQNLYAWDYNKKSPTTRKHEEFAAIRRLSAQLLSKSIKFAKPDAIVFAVGCNSTNDNTIKQMLNEEFNGYQTLEVVKGHYWHFVADGITCYRVAHPRTQISKHVMYRQNTMDYLIKLFVLKQGEQ